MKASFVSILATAALFISTVQCMSYNLWSAERKSGRVAFIPYTLAQRRSIVENIDRMMKSITQLTSHCLFLHPFHSHAIYSVFIMDLTNHQMWVSSDSKQSHYKGKANPYSDLDTFRKTYAGMTDEQFNFDLTRIFNKMRDPHTLYYKAGPYGCFGVSTGLFFKSVDDSLGSSEPPKVRVVGITDAPEILNLIGNVLSAVAIGDELLTVNGVLFDKWYEQNKFILGFGANDSGGHSGAFKYLAEISGSSNILPEDDSITFQLKRFGGNQELYTVTVPYVALSNDECWSLSSSLYKELNSIALPEIPASTSFKYKRSVSGNATGLSGNRALHKRDTHIHKRSYWESVQFEDTNIDDLTWTIWKNGGKNMGVIKIKSFSLVLKDTKEDTNFLFFILTIRDLLVNQLKDTDAILFDIRDNGGGLVHAADGIIQLFKLDATASTFRYLKNDATESLFYKGLNSKNPWSKAWSATSYTSRYSDRGIGTIFGEDETTGGGGANVLSSDDSYFTDRPLEYIADPFKEKLTGENSGHKFYTKITVGVRQLVRSGDYAGELVEDNGVKSDVIVRSTIADILPGDTGASNYDRIANYLGDVAKRQADSKIYFISEPYNRATFDDLIYIPFVASGVDEIIVVYQGEQLGKWERKSSALSQTDVITVKTPKGLQDHLITFIGKKRGTQVFKAHREITRIPTPNNRVSMMTAKSYTVLGPSSGVGVYSFGSMSEQEGWNFNDDKWVIGDGISDYSGYMSSIIRVWLSAPIGSRISVSLDATVDTPEDRGRFSLVVMDNFGKMVPVVSPTSKNGLIQYRPITGRNRVIKETYSFTATSREFSLNMKFVSYGMESPFSVKFNPIVITKD
ncbi:hypothetical protein BASA60_008737 [Batrachochytrium salamandrivorans]|nr:hypothetical protein BASA60_008737 [Batrachochytrium salamandrivorans]